MQKIQNKHTAYKIKLHHDVIAYEKVIADRGIPKERIRNMALNETLVKRFDY